MFVLVCDQTSLLKDISPHEAKKTFLILMGTLNLQILITVPLQTELRGQTEEAHGLGMKGQQW